MEFKLPLKSLNTTHSVATALASYDPQPHFHENEDWESNIEPLGGITNLHEVLEEAFGSRTSLIKEISWLSSLTLLTSMFGS
jgi:hypothetical protein